MTDALYNCFYLNGNERKIKNDELYESFLEIAVSQVDVRFVPLP